MMQGNDPLQVGSGERGIVRVFSFQPAEEEIALLKQKHGVDRLLGVSDVNPDEVEVFPVSDLAGMGLADYLIEGHGVPAIEVAPDRAKLDAVKDAVMIVRSRAFHGKAVTLRPAPELTLVSSYEEEGADWTAEPLQAESAAPYTGVRQARTSPDPGARRSAGSFAVVAVIILAVLVLIYLLLFSAPFL